MSITVYPIPPGFAAEVRDVDLSQPLAGEDLAACEQAGMAVPSAVEA